MLDEQCCKNTLSPGLGSDSHPKVMEQREQKARMPLGWQWVSCGVTQMRRACRTPQATSLWAKNVLCSGSVFCPGRLQV